MPERAARIEGAGKIGWRRASLHRVAVMLTISGLLVSGCAQPGSSSDPSGSAEPSGDDGVAYARAEVEKYLQPRDEYEPPGPEITNAAALQGSTVYYIPLSTSIPYFAATLAALREAFDRVGVDVQACDAQANPSGAASCLDDALANDADGIITDAVSDEWAENSLRAIRSDGTPLLIVNQLTPDGHEQEENFQYQIGSSHRFMTAAAHWIIADSNGSADILISSATDNPTSFLTIDDYAVPELEKHCADCSFAISRMPFTTLHLLPSEISASLLRDRDTKYVLNQYDSILQQVLQGVQDAGAVNDVKGVSATAALNALQLIAEGRFLYADVGQNQSYQGWAVADQMMRMILGMDPLPADTEIPIRIFTRDNIDSLSLTPKAFQSGEWYGSLEYKNMFAELWNS